MNVRDREKALMDLVEEYREVECGRILKRANRQVSVLIGRVYKEQRRLLHERVVTERRRVESRIRAAEAEFQTARRRHRQQASFAILEVGWRRLEPCLTSRWKDPRWRRQWVDAALQNALIKLPREGWIIRHPPDWEPKEQEAAVMDLTNRLKSPPVFESRQSLRAGLIIESAGTLLDATPDGLLKDRNAIEARLLALLEAEQSP